MPRSNRRRRDNTDDDSFERFLGGMKRTESRRGLEYYVQPLSAAKALKEYTCPGCSQIVPLGVAHLVVWRADGIMGDAADLAARRHWHTHCWRMS